MPLSRQKSTRLKQGFLQIYTGNGKGKTTAAVGLAVRALGRGFNVYFAQFMKSMRYGEIEILHQFEPRVTLVRWGNDGFVFKKELPSAELQEEMQKGLRQAEEAMLSGAYDLVILDEILVSIYFHLFSTKQILEFVRKRPTDVELVLTGRYCPPDLIDVADLVTEMNEVKHYYHNGILARTGIEN